MHSDTMLLPLARIYSENLCKSNKEKELLCGTAMNWLNLALDASEFLHSHQIDAADRFLPNPLHINCIVYGKPVT